jgi:hypothetical protein
VVFTERWSRFRIFRALIELGGLVQKAGLADQLRHGKEDDERSPQQLAFL